MSSEIHATIRKRLQDAQNILIASHIRPDGDAIGSLLGLGLALKEAGKQVQMVLVDGIPSSFRHLTGSDEIVRTPSGDHDTLIAVDASDLARLGGAFGGRQPDIEIDHHVTNLNYAHINLVVPEAVATAAVLAESLPLWGLKITEPIASALLTGIITDTIGFRTSNMNAQALRLSADLIDAGAQLPELYFHALVKRSFEAARYWGMGLSRLNKKDRLIWATLTRADRKVSGYTGNDDADLTNVLSSINEGDISVLFIEQHDNHVKVSWRSQPGWDVSKIAFSFGGGGHPAAAGADIPGTLDEIVPQVLAATEKLLYNNGNGNSK